MFPIIAAGITAAATVAGGALSAKGNAAAGNQLAGGFAQSEDAYKRAETNWNDFRMNAQGRYKPIVKNAIPANVYFRNLIATEGGGLTPGQKQELDDIRRSTLSSLSTSGLRGSGRATTAALRGVETDALGRFTAENRERAMRAAGVLSSQGIHAKDVITNAGQAWAAGQAQGLAAQGDNSVLAAIANAQNTTANANMWGQTIGDLSSTIAGSVKDYARGSKYPGT